LPQLNILCTSLVKLYYTKNNDSPVNRRSQDIIRLLVVTHAENDCKIAFELNFNGVFFSYQLFGNYSVLLATLQLRYRRLIGEKFSAVAEMSEDERTGKEFPDPSADTVSTSEQKL